MHSERYDPIYLFFCRTRALVGDAFAMQELRNAVWSEDGDTRAISLYFLSEIGDVRRGVRSIQSGKEAACTT